MKIVKIALGVVVAVLVAVGVTAIIARNSDGPIGMLPGGPLVSGEVVERPVIGWGRARNVDTIEMQLVGDDTSRTTWFVEYLGRGYIPASLSFPPGKTWHERADGAEAWLRFDGKRYHVRLSRVHDAETIAAVREKIGKKYGGAPGGEAWLFKVRSLANTEAQFD